MSVELKMAGNTSMTICLASYFWIALILLVLKVVTGLKGMVLDGCFFLISLIVMVLLFTSIMKERCGTAPFGEVLSTLVLPWIMMVGGMMVLMKIFPGWIQPFSNTFGYIVCMIPGINAQQKLTAILTPDKNSMSKLIVEDPTLMLNQFSSSRFDDIIDKMVEGGVVNKSNPQAVSDFAGIVRIKDSVAEFMWHFLVGCVAITTAYNNMMNTVCQKDTITDSPPVDPTDPTSTPAATQST